MSEVLFPSANFPLYRNEQGHVRDVRKKDLQSMVERWLSPDTLGRLSTSQQAVVRSLAMDVDFLIRGGRFPDYSTTGKR